MINNSFEFLSYYTIGKIYGIFVGLKEITWIHSSNKNLRKAVVQGLEPTHNKVS